MDQTPFQLLYHNQFDYPNLHVGIGHCDLWVYTDGSSPILNAVVIASDSPTNWNGTSVTNAVEYLATQVYADFGLPLDHTTWIEHYPGLCNGSMEKYQPTFSVVTFHALDHRGWQHPDWRYITPQEAASILRQPLPPELLQSSSRHEERAWLKTRRD